jgi:hypothetical protein
VIAATNSQVAARVTPRIVDLVAALATGSVGSVALARPDISYTLPWWINSDRIDKTTIRQADVQAVADQWANPAGWSVIGVTATGNHVLVDATGPKPAPDLAVLRHDLDAAGLASLDVRVSLVTLSYQPVPR